MRWDIRPFLMTAKVLEMIETSKNSLREPKFSIAFSTALLIHMALVFIWAGATSERLSQLERQASATRQIIERTARLEAQANYMKASLDRIEVKISELPKR